MKELDSLAIGMITCPREACSPNQTIDSLRYGGFLGTIHVFAEPGTDIQDTPNVALHRNSRRLGAPANWFGSIEYVFQHSTTRAILMIEDDVAFCRGAQHALQKALSEIGEFGYLSLYTPVREANRLGLRGRGWVPLGRTDVWGTQAICFNRKHLSGFIAAGQHLLSHPRAVTYDLIMAQYFRSAVQRPCYYHVPSLCDHVGWQETTILREAEFRPDMTLRHLHRGLEFDPEYMP